jgi:bifunctional UDP-N-acetylglucosamine pyrophosphorylase/glucosamine-1-phosphate N-acetyltransferase/UDP-N-acetylglucosamine pyrophosphorylase
MTRKLAVVLAAGKGTRMKSELPKVLIPVCGRPMVQYVVNALTEAGMDQIVLVVGYRSDLVRQALAGQERITFVEQPEQLGTGHAVMVCREVLEKHYGPVLVVTGDAPMMQSESICALLDEFQRTQPSCLIGTLHKSNPDGLGRIVRDREGRFEGIVEQRDATPQQLQITEVNMSCYVFDCRDLLFALGRIRSDNAQREYYITDCPAALKAAGKRIEALPVLKPIEALGVNTMEELQEVERVLCPERVES